VLGNEFSSAVLPVIGAVLLVADEAPTVKLRDDCQPATFNGPGGPGPNTCRADFNGQTSFQKFIEELTKHQRAPEWRFDPTRRDVEAGTQLLLDNYGGETHTFTRVEMFGGGFVPPLNTLSGNLVPAPECLAQSVGATFVLSGAEGKQGPTLQNADRGKSVKFQCCIHPWMRTEVMVR
jgi:hypothetical protein